MIPEQLVFIDLETTGTNTLHDRITEVGLCEVSNGRVVDEWSTLVNPEKAIPPFIEKLTGITTGMVADAPRFADIATELQERLAGKVLVAHNVRFDVGFLKSEFRRQAIDFHERTVCTVKLSRALFPQQSRHNLDALIERHELEVANRHRALGDARATQKFFEKMCLVQPSEIMAKAIESQLKKPSMPPHLPADQLHGLPGTPGVYLLYGENDAVLYIGKSVNIRSRVHAHFAGDHRVRKGMKLSQQVRRIDCIETAGELGALLLEARLVKELAPIHNRRLRRTCDLFSIHLVSSAEGHPLIELIALKGLQGADLGRMYGMFRSRRQADAMLRQIIAAQGLCNRVLGLEKGQGACFSYQLRKCRGACVGQEPLPLHQARLMTALAALKMRSWPFEGAIGVRERSPGGGRTEIHVFDQWCHLGTADSEHRLRALLENPAPLPFDLDSYKILSRYLDTQARPADVLNLAGLRPEAQSC